MDHALLDALTAPDETVRAEAREELGLLMDDDIARAYLEVIARNPVEEIVADTIVGLGPIIEEAGIDFDEDSELEEADELGPEISRETFETIIREIRAVYADQKRPKLVRRRAFEVLVRDPKPWQADEIRRLFATDDREWKLTAIFGMGTVPGFDREIAALVDTAEGDVLFEAIRAAAQMEVTEVAMRVRDLAQSGKDKEIQLAAIEALPHVDPKCQNLLEKLAGSKDRPVADAARAALDELAVWAEGEED